MKKTTQIHMGGRHFVIDEDAYQKLNHYLESLEKHFTAEGDTGREIVDDIEQRIAELLEGKITNGKQSVTLEDINDVITTLGKVEDFVYDEESDDKRKEYDVNNRKDYRRLYRDPDNYYFGGVASGLGEYFDIDPVWIRIAFVLLLFLKGAGLLLYLILWLVVPRARTTAEKLQMKGKPVNLSTIKDSVNEEYEKVRSADHSSTDRARNIFENIFRTAGLIIVALFKFMIAAIGVIFLILGSIFLAGLVMFILGFTNLFGHFQMWNGVDLPQLTGFFSSTSHYYMAVIALVVVFLIPIIALIYGGIKLLFNIRTHHPVLRAFLLTGWILALILFITLVIMGFRDSPINASETQSAVITLNDKEPYLALGLKDNSENKRLTRYWVMGYHFNYSHWDEDLYDQAQLNISKSADDQMHLTVTRKTKNVDPETASDYIDEVDYTWEQKDSALYLNKYYRFESENFWLFPQVDVDLSIPEGRKIMIDQEICDVLTDEQRKEYCNDNSLVGKPSVMTAKGILEPAN